MTRSIDVVVMARSIDVSTHQIIGGRDEQEDVILVAQCGRYTVAVARDATDRTLTYPAMLDAATMRP